jgi:hypothetical protein
VLGKPLGRALFRHLVHARAGGEIVRGCSWATSASRQDRATLGTRLSSRSPMVRSSVSTVSTDLGHDPELREMRPDRVDQSGSLTAEHLAGSVQNEHTLLLKRTYRSTTLDRLGLGESDSKRVFQLC